MAPRRAQGAEWLPDTCSKADLAVVLGISTRAVSDWDTRGVLVRAAGGRYQTLASINNYIAHLRDKKAGRATGDSTSGSLLAQEKAETARVVRRIKEIELSKLEGEVLTLDEMSEAWSTFAGKFKATMMSMASALASQIPHITRHDQQTIKRICRDKLRDLAAEAEDTVPAAQPGDIVDDQ